MLKVFSFSMKKQNRNEIELYAWLMRRNCHLNDEYSMATEEKKCEMKRFKIEWLYVSRETNTQTCNISKLPLIKLLGNSTHCTPTKIIAHKH